MTGIELLIVAALVVIVVGVPVGIVLVVRALRRDRQVSGPDRSVPGRPGA